MKALMRETLDEEDGKKTGGDEGERGGRRCLIIQQNQCSLFMGLLEEPGGTVSTVVSGLGQRFSPKKDGKQKEKRD